METQKLLEALKAQMTQQEQKTEVEKVLSIKKLVIHYIGPVIGAHTGQGVLAVFFLAKHR